MITTEKGTLSFKGEVETRTSQAGREWSRQTVVIDTEGFQGAIRKIALTAGSRTLQDVERCKIGDKVEVRYEVNSREWSGKWFTNVDLISIKSEEGERTEEARHEVEALADDPEGDLPF